MRKILERCPTCGGDVLITRLGCKRCDTVVLGRYEPCQFCKLAPQHTEFVLAFLRNRGNLKEMERESGQSYWALRAQLNAVIEAMGFEAPPTKDEESATAGRRQVLERLEHGDIAVEEAVAALARLRRPAETSVPEAGAPANQREENSHNE